MQIFTTECMIRSELFQQNKYTTLSKAQCKAEGNRATFLQVNFKSVLYQPNSIQLMKNYCLINVLINRVSNPTL